MNAPEGYVSLEFVGFTDKGEYSPESVYVKNDLAHIDNSIWKCLEDNTTGVDPGNDDEKWEIFMRSASEASGILAIDTEGIAGEKNKKVSTQVLLDEITGSVNQLRNPEFVDYTDETEVPEPEAAVGKIISGEPVGIIYQYTKASLKGILTIAKKALNIALGKNQARVFASIVDLDAWLAVPENTEKLNVGDNFYIIATDVPDYWWDGSQKQKLETQKVDLTTYDQSIANLQNGLSELNEKLDSKHAVAWGEPSYTDICTGGFIQWQRYGRICTVTMAAYINVLTDTDSNHIVATDLPSATFGMSVRGIFMDVDSNCIYTMSVNQVGELVLRTTNGISTGIRRINGFVTYVCNI